MTTLTEKGVTRESAEVDPRTRKPFVVQLAPGGKLLRMRPKGTQKWYTVTLAQVWLLACKNEVELS